MIKKIVFSIFLFINIQVFAQGFISNKNNSDVFYNYTHWGIQVDGLMYSPAEVDNFNKFFFESQHANGYKFGLVYNLSFNKNFGFRTGLFIGQMPVIKTELIIPGKAINLNTDYHHTGSIYNSLFSNFSIPLLFEYRNYTFNRFILNLDAGIHIDKTSNKIYSDIYQDHYITQVSHAGTFDMNLVLKLGWYYQFKPIMLQTNLVYKHHLNNQYEGSYTFTNIKVEHANINQCCIPYANGSYIQKGDYIGLSLTFYFYKENRTVNMGCRTKTQSKEAEKREAKVIIKKDKDKIKRLKKLEKERKKKAKKLRRKAKRKGIF